MERLPLNEYNRLASLGNDYLDLAREYPLWAHDLHERGNEMDNANLERIAVKGLIRWYHFENIDFDMDYKYYEYLLHFLDSPHSITYYDMIQLNALAVHANITPIYIPSHDAKHNLLMNSLHADMFAHYACIGWSNYLIDVVGIVNLRQYIESLIQYIEKSIYWYCEGSWFNTFLFNYPEIKKLGIIFQKFKIVLEKISLMPDKFKQDIYKLDIFVDTIQSAIYSICMYYIQNYFRSNSNHIIIRNIEWIDNEYLYRSHPQHLFNFTDIEQLQCRT